ncbi:hypothetical protein WG909_02465 [Peptostreptococcaceae bacterium AGR-M142]
MENKLKKDMKDSMAKNNEVLKNFNKNCRVISCMHCLNNKCQNDHCDFYERSFIQEG